MSNKTCVSFCPFLCVSMKQLDGPVLLDTSMWFYKDCSQNFLGQVITIGLKILSTTSASIYTFFNLNPLLFSLPEL